MLLLPVFAPRYQSQVLHSAGLHERLAKVSEHLESTSSVHGWRWSEKVGAGQPLWGALQRQSSVQSGEGSRCVSRDIERGMSPGRVLNSMRMFGAFDCSHESQRSNLWAGKSLNSCLLLAVFIPVWLCAVCDADRGEGDGKRQQSHFFTASFIITSRAHTTWRNSGVDTKRLRGGQGVTPLPRR